MTWANETCDDCGGQTLGGPMLRTEVWETIAKPEAVSVPAPCDPGEPFLFPLIQQVVVETFLCFGCIERRLGRQLTQEDLNISLWNAGWIDNDNAGDEEWIEEWKVRNGVRGRRLLPHATIAA